jgi:hypothetical protein
LRQARHSLWIRRWHACAVGRGRILAFRTRNCAACNRILRPRDLLKQSNPYGFKASFNPTHPGEPGNSFGGWFSPWHYGLNQGPIELMIENYRSGMIWRLMRECTYIQEGLRRAGFTGGWLAEHAKPAG